MTARIVEIQRVLKTTGTFYLHCDPSASHYLKLITDSVFLPTGGDFLNEVIWKRTSAHVNPKRWGPVHDVILLYAKSDKYTWNPVYQEYDSEYLRVKYRHKDQRGHYRLSDLTGAGWTEGSSGKDWRDFSVRELGRHWAVPKDEVISLVGSDKASKMTTQEKLDLLDKNGFIYKTPRGRRGGVGFPQFKRYLSGGVPIQDVITDVSPVNSQAKEQIGYPTQKPVALLERIIKASSNEGDLILDAYCGCGTTISSAQRLNRHWIGMDITAQAMSTIYLRLEEEFPDLDLRNIAEGGAPRDLKAARLWRISAMTACERNLKNGQSLHTATTKPLFTRRKAAIKALMALHTSLQVKTKPTKWFYR